MDDWRDDVPACGLCGGFLCELGALGSVTHYRCRACGMDFNTSPAPSPAPAESEVSMRQGRSVLALLFLLLSLFSVACADSPTGPQLGAPLETSMDAPAFAAALPVCAPEALECFTSLAVVSGGNVTLTSIPVVSQDLPASGYANRWRYVLAQSAAPAVSYLVGEGPFSANVCVGAVWLSNDPLNGGMDVSVGPYIQLRLAPSYVGVREQLGEIAPVSECRQQVFDVRQLSTGEYEVMITEISS
jgi:hypothetical protein